MVNTKTAPLEWTLCPMCVNWPCSERAENSTGRALGGVMAGGEVAQKHIREGVNGAGRRGQLGPWVLIATWCSASKQMHSAFWHIHMKPKQHIDARF